MRLAVLFHRFGPYHLARLSAAARWGDLVGVELSGGGGEYAWHPVTTDAFERVTVYPEGDTNDLPNAERIARVEAALDRVRPDVLAVAGYADSGMLAAARWGLRRRKAMVLMSDSQYRDEPRRWWKEWIKRRIVSCFGSALAAGATHTQYLRRLGMPPDKIFTGYDVVDNDHFARGADAARNDPGARSRLGLPERYFLASARFVEKKNLPRLLDAHKDYRSRGTAHPWDLVLLGDGPLRPMLEAQIERLDLGSYVSLPGFRQYDELPAYYGLASAFLLPSAVDQWGLVVNEAMASGLPVIVSEACGSVSDLVRPGENGFAFPPRDTGRLAGLMVELSGDANRAAAMGRRSRELIGEWSPERFAESLWHAAQAATPRGGPLRKLAMNTMLCR